MKAVISAGGMGTRLRSVNSELPKPMVPVGDKPVLAYQVENLKACGITQIIMTVGYKSETIMDYFKDGSGFGVHIEYIEETRPMGTGGALYYLRGRMEEDFLFLNGDLMLSVDFGRFMEQHKRSGAAVTLFAHPNMHPFDSDILLTDGSGKFEDFTKERCGMEVAEETYVSGGEGCIYQVTGLLGKHDERPGDYPNLVNAGIYALSKDIPELVPSPEEKQKTDLDKEIIRPLIGKGRVWCYRSTEYVKDMGTPERLAAAARDVETGAVEARNLRHPQKCIFLDRDGTFNYFRGYIGSPDRLELLEGAAGALRRINESGYLAILITNQPGVSWGESSFEELNQIFRHFETLLGNEGAYLDDIFYCPHHTDTGFEGEVKELKFHCRCRKPETGLIMRAARRYNIDLSSSYMIGDTTTDIRCGKNAGVKTVLLDTGLGGKDGKYDVEPDLRAVDLAEAVKLILQES